MFNKSLLSKAVQYSLLLGSAAFISTSYAADEQKENTEIEEEAPERIEVTGSRIRRAEFSQASPIQVISGDFTREMGLFDAGEMLQSTNQAAGTQINNTFGGYVLDNGPGSATVGFRGLGAERTLVLINGRRMAPAGVGGAPTSADLNLIPAVMIQRVENLFDGASTVYGSDAVAGVANIILRKDMEGFEVQGSYRQPKGDGGEETVLSAMWGKTYDNGFVTVGAEYNQQESQSRAGNPFLQGCEERIWESEEGDIITRNSGNGPVASDSACDIFPLTNRMSIPVFWGSVYYTPGFTNTGIPNFSETTVSPSLEGYLPTWVRGDFNGDGIIDFDMGDGVFVDGDGDGLRDVDFQNPLYAYQQSDYYRSGDYRSEQKRYSVMLTGEHTLENDTTFYYEGLYAKRESPIFNPGAQIFQSVDANNAYNPCGVYGIDCFEMLGAGPAGPLSVQPILNIRGDRDYADVEVEQYRVVAGFTADLPSLQEIGLENWYYDVYASYSASKGTNNLTGISEPRLLQSLDTTVATDGTVSCTDTSNGCVPVNLFSENIYQAGGGTLTDAEANFLFVDRYMETKVNQTVINGFVGGDMFTLPWNNEVVSGIFGAEYRRDEIESNPNDVTAQGLLWGYFADQGADGSRNLKEIFTEMDFPLLRGQEFAEELTFTASGRVSEESFYDAESTYSLKVVYRPVDWVTLRATKGTSYRAPNLRERFLNGTSGFGNVTDPCVVPEGARQGDPLDPNAIPTYDPNEDGRSQATLDACIADGVDPTSLGLGADGSEPFNPTNSTEITSGGSEELDPETSLAKTWGFVLEQPFSDDFDLTVSATRFDIEVTNSIAEPSAAYSVDQCYSADGNDAFCSRLMRDPSSGQIVDVDGTFINIGLITSKGYDFNVFYDQDFVMFENTFGLTVDLQATKMTESVYDVLGTVDDNLGEPDYPEWRGYGRMKLEYSDYSFNWETRYIGKGEEDDLGEFEEFTDGCTGLTNSSGAPLQCRPLAYTDDYWVHNASFNFDFDSFSITAGVRNVFNEAPPKVDPAGSFSSHNIPLGVGYDTFGRTPFINFNASF